MAYPRHRWFTSTGGEDLSPLEIPGWLCNVGILWAGSLQRVMTGIRLKSTEGVNGFFHDLVLTAAHGGVRSARHVSPWGAPASPTRVDRFVALDSFDCESAWPDLALLRVTRSGEGLKPVAELATCDDGPFVLLGSGDKYLQRMRIERDLVGEARERFRCDDKTLAQERILIGHPTHPVSGNQASVSDGDSGSPVLSGRKVVAVVSRSCSGYGPPLVAATKLDASLIDAIERVMSNLPEVDIGPGGPCPPWLPPLFAK